MYINQYTPTPTHVPSPAYPLNHHNEVSLNGTGTGPGPGPGNGNENSRPRSSSLSADATDPEKQHAQFTNSTNNNNNNNNSIRLTSSLSSRSNSITSTPLGIGTGSSKRRENARPIRQPLKGWDMGDEARAYVEYLEEQLQSRQQSAMEETDFPELSTSASNGVHATSPTVGKAEETRTYITHLETQLQTHMDENSAQIAHLRAVNTERSREARALKRDVLELKVAAEKQVEETRKSEGGLRARIRELEGVAEAERALVVELEGAGSGGVVVEMEREVERLRGKVVEDRRIIMALQDENEELRLGGAGDGGGEVLEGVVSLDEDEDGECILDEDEEDARDASDSDDSGEETEENVHGLEVRVLGMSIDFLKDQVEHFLIFCR